MFGVTNRDNLQQCKKTRPARIHSPSPDQQLRGCSMNEAVLDIRLQGFIVHLSKDQPKISTKFTRSQVSPYATLVPSKKFLLSTIRQLSLCKAPLRKHKIK